MRKLFLSCALFALVLSMQAQKNVKFEFQTSEARTLDLYPSTYIHPLIAEVVVDTKTGRIHDSWNLSFEDYKAREDSNSSQATLQISGHMLCLSLRRNTTATS